MRADELRALHAADTTRDTIARRWLHALPPDLPFVAAVTLEPDRFWPGPDYANHGTPHPYDARVPLLFWGASFRPARFRSRARVVDIAPTLAHVLGITPTEALDGRVLTEAFRHQSADVGN
jgi:hypothetical protein